MTDEDIQKDAETFQPELLTNVHPESSHTEPQKKQPKRRKSQSEEDYQQHKELYQSNGPLIQTENYLLELDYKTLDPKSKMDRGRLKNAAERAYYVKDYKKCIEIINTIDSWESLGARDRGEYEEIRNAAQAKLNAL